MKPLPLDQIGWNWESHKSALWWIGLLYRRPKEFDTYLKDHKYKKGRVNAILISLKLYLHFLPWMILFILIWRLFIFEVLNISVESEPITLFEHFYFHLAEIIYNITRGIIFGITFVTVIAIIGGVIVKITGGITRGILGGITRGIAGGITSGLAVGITVGIAVGIGEGIYGGIARDLIGRIIIGIIGGIATGVGIGICVGIVGGIARGVAEGNTEGIFGGIIVGIAGGVLLGIAEGIASGTSFIIGVLRIYYFPLHLACRFPVPQYPRLKLHPVYWDDRCSVPFPGIERILVAHTEANASEGMYVIEHIIDNYPSQRLGAQKAKTILIARQTANATNLVDIESPVNQLPEGKKGFLTQTNRIKEIIHQICQLQHQLDTIHRPFLKVPYASELYTKIENFKHEIGGFEEPLVSEFRKAATAWLLIARKQMEQAKSILTKEPTPQVFRAGDPVNSSNEAFVIRYKVVGELEKQILHSTTCPGLVLYGRRRMGKTTILNNLGGFLPPSVKSVFISMQSARAFTSIRDLSQLLAENFARILPEMKITIGSDDSLKAIFDILEAVNNNLKPENQRILICLDEYENIDQKIGDGTFSKDLLATIRESIQTHRQLTWIFTGSHEITELTNAPWTSYLVSARTIEVPLFTPDETYLLLTEPMKYSPLWKKDDPKRPSFTPEFWGENGIQRLHKEAGGWPHLVQLIAETIVDLVNESEKTQADDTIFEEALNQSIVKGHNVLYELMHGECKLPGEWEYLAAFRRKASQPIPDSEAIYRSLKRRLLVVEENGEFRLRVPLMERWLKERG